MDAGEGGFVAQEQGECGGAVGEAAEEPGEVVFILDFGEILGEVFFGEDALVFQELGFHGRGAAKAPAGDGDGVDQLGFDRVGRLEAVEVGVEEGFEIFFGFVREDGEFGGEAVFEGVARGAGFAFEGDGASGFLAVDAGGFGFVHLALV